MLKKGWDFIKENVAAIVTVVTAILTVVYAIMRLCIYVYWRTDPVHVPVKVCGLRDLPVGVL